jgi:3-oxoacyl-[acyl-carrier protein] reductase
MDLDLSERTALVTGAGRGNGRATARSLADHGASVVVNDLDEAAAEETRERIQEAGGEVIAVPADVSDRDEVAAMVEHGYGKVVNVTSIHTAGGVGMSSQYDVGKYALLGLTKSLAKELGRDGVRVNAVAPGWVDTRMTEGFIEAVREQITELNPLGRFARPEDVADAITFLAAPASDHVNGHELRVDGGQAPIDSWRLDNR